MRLTLTLVTFSIPKGSLKLSPGSGHNALTREPGFGLEFLDEFPKLPTRHFFAFNLVGEIGNPLCPVFEQPGPDSLPHRADLPFGQRTGGLPHQGSQLVAQGGSHCLRHRIDADLVGDCLEEVVEAIASVDWHKLVAQSVGGCVQ